MEPAPGEALEGRERLDGRHEHAGDDPVHVMIVDAHQVGAREVVYDEGRDGQEEERHG